MAKQRTKRAEDPVLANGLTIEYHDNEEGKKRKITFPTQSENIIFRGREYPIKAFLDAWDRKPDDIRAAEMARGGYASYVDVGVVLLEAAAKALKNEQTRLRRELGEARQNGLDLACVFPDLNYVPRAAVSPELLENLRRCLKFIIDQGKALERYHRQSAGGRCQDCGRKLPRGKRLYCSKKCTDRFLQRRHRAKAWTEDMAKQYHVHIDLPGCHAYLEGSPIPLARSPSKGKARPRS